MDSLDSSSYEPHEELPRLHPGQEFASVEPESLVSIGLLVMAAIIGGLILVLWMVNKAGSGSPTAPVVSAGKAAASFSPWFPLR
jgi:hypothetical protein